MLIKMNKQNGFSMIEVLVSLLIIGVGMLGLSGLQIASTKGTVNAHSRNIASMLAFDLSERMRANPKGISEGHYKNNVTCSTKPSKLCDADICSPSELAIFDTYEVMCGMSEGSEGGLKNLLVSGTLSVDCTGGDCSKPKAEHNITIGWSDQELKKNSQTASKRSVTISIIP